VKTKKRAKPYRGLLVVGGYEDDLFLRPARANGDWDLFTQYIEEGNVITSAMRKYIAGILRGEERRKRKRPRKRDTTERAMQIISFVNDAISSGMKPGKANLAAAEKFGVNVKTVQRAMALDRWNSFREEEARVDALLEDLEEQQQDWQTSGDDDN
jgi:hypothetical protein